jgi:hypothetical protein
MNCLLLPALLAPVAVPAPEVRGQYVEARTCDVYTGSCFANADTGLTGKNAVLAWKVESGCFGGSQLDGLGVVAVVAARETLGLKQSAPGKAILIVDERATKAQREALIKLVQAQAGDLVADVVAVRSAPVDLTICPCENDGCAVLTAGKAKVRTRCLDVDHDKACGNETTLYPPLAKNVRAKAAMAVEHCFSGQGLNETWSDGHRRGAFVGGFSCYGK